MYEQETKEYDEWKRIQNLGATCPRRSESRVWKLRLNGFAVPWYLSSRLTLSDPLAAAVAVAVACHCFSWLAPQNFIDSQGFRL
jgi:hypothetical protein